LNDYIKAKGIHDVETMNTMLAFTMRRMPDTPADMDLNNQSLVMPLEL